MSCEAEILTLALRGKWRFSYGTARCPAHDDTNPSLTIRRGETGKPLLWCHAGCSQEAILAALASMGLWEGKSLSRQSPSPSELAKTRSEAAAQRRKRVELARQIWNETRPANGTPAERYLRKRGISGLLPPVLRYHPDLFHSPTGLYLPALVAAVCIWPGNQPSGIHRTLITNEGDKANVSSPKLMLGECQRGAVRLAPPGHVLAVAEGIETALSVQKATGLPTWAALSTSGIKGLLLPSYARQVQIYADNDASGAGEKAARAAAERWIVEGRSVLIRLPKEVGTDFNDILRQGVADGR